MYTFFPPLPPFQHTICVSFINKDIVSCRENNLYIYAHDVAAVAYQTAHQQETKNLISFEIGKFLQFPPKYLQLLNLIVLQL